MAHLLTVRESSYCRREGALDGRLRVAPVYNLRWNLACLLVAVHASALTLSAELSLGARADWSAESVSKRIV